MGFAVTLAPVEAERLAEGDHVNEVDVPLAVSPVDAPLQIVTPALAFVVGRELTVTVTLAVAVQLPIVLVNV